MGLAMRLLLQWVWWNEMNENKTFRTSKKWILLQMFFLPLYLYAFTMYTIKLCIRKKYRKFHHKMVDWELWRHILCWVSAIVNLCWITMKRDCCSCSLFSVYDVEAMGCVYNVENMENGIRRRYIFIIIHLKGKIWNYINWERR